MGNNCGRRAQAANGRLTIHDQNDVIAVPENDEYLDCLASVRKSYRQKISRAVMKILLILRLRQEWSRLSAWMNVNKSQKNPATKSWRVISRNRALVTVILKRRNSRVLCEHLVRVEGRLRYRTGGEAEETED